MADVAIATNASGTFMQSGHRFALASPDENTVYQYYIDDQNDLIVRKSTDGGANWSTAGTVRTGTVSNFSIWADWWAGESGSLIHCVYHDSGVDDIFYRSLDVSSDTLGTERTVVAGSGDPTIEDQWIIQTSTGRLYAGGSALGISTRMLSDDGGANWSAYASFMELAADLTLGLPGNYADPDDFVVYYWDISANELTYKVYDASADTVGGETTVATGVAETTEANSPTQFTAVVRPDGKHYVFVWNGYDVSTADLKAFLVDPSSATVTALTDVVSNSDDCFGVAASVDWNTGDIYVWYQGKSDGSEAAASAVKIYRKISTDDGATWGAESAYSEDAADDFRGIWADMGSDNFLAGASWYDDDDLDIFFGPTNAVEITAGGDDVVVTIGLLSVATAAFAPTAAAPRIATPSKASLATSVFAPSLISGIVSRPDFAELETSPFAPTVLAPRLATPATLALLLSAFAPTVSAPYLATVSKLALALTTFAPSVNVGQNIVPALAELELEAFVPTVATPVLSTPAVAALALSAFAPAVSAPRFVTPSHAALTLDEQAAVVSTLLTAIIGTASLSDTQFAPAVLAPSSVVPATLGQVLTAFAPSVLAPRTSVPSIAQMLLSTFTPDVATPRVAQPSALALTLTALAPVLASPQTITPGVAALVLAVFAPEIIAAIPHVISLRARMSVLEYEAVLRADPVLRAAAAALEMLASERTFSYEARPTTLSYRVRS